MRLVVTIGPNCGLVLKHLFYFVGPVSIFKRLKYDVLHSTDQRLLDSQLRTAISSSAPARHIYNLLLRGADANCVDSLGYSPLLLALKAHSSEYLLDTVRILCEFGANANYRSNVFYGDSPLHFAAALNNYELIEQLYHFNADVHTRNHAGYTSLHVAAQNGNEVSVAALFLCGADLDSKENYCGYTPLHLAVIGQFQDVVTSLVSLGASINQTDNCGLTPIDRSTSEVIRALLVRALQPNVSSLESRCLAIIREKVRNVAGINGFDNLPLPLTLKKKLQLR